ncbi:MAG: hypothetical protein J2P46_17930, partial [Zavarzinella sp.]|nr:hypothetical protein [Zavarzinella sp.]
WLIGELCGLVGMKVFYKLLKEWTSGLPGWAEDAGTFVAGPLVAFVAAAGVYAYFRARTREDADYGPPDPDAVDDRAWPPRRKPH